MDSNEIMKKMEDKFKILDINDKSTARILEDNKERELRRHLQAIESRLQEIYSFRQQVENILIEENESVEKVEEWGAEFDVRVERFEHTIEMTSNAISALDSHREKEKIERERQEEKLRLRRRFEEERRLEEMRLQFREQYQSKQSVEKTLNTQEGDMRVKLPKLSITKFNGPVIDWTRFWNQFSTEIDTAKISNVSKFSYLKELLDSKVRLLIDGLPFTSEGYERAKNILQTKYGKTSEIVTAHVKGIMDLPAINGSNAAKIHEFYQKLLTHVQAMETMGKLKTINGYVRLLIDRLPGIRSDLVRDDDQWHAWEFPQLVEAIRRWTERNPIPEEGKEHSTPHRRFERTLQTDQKPWKSNSCAYCDSERHKPINCQRVTSPEARKQLISKKRLCFNCLGANHRASECKSQKGCSKCGARHHSSICNKSREPTDQTMLTSETRHVTYPVVVVKVNGVKCRALEQEQGAHTHQPHSSIALVFINHTHQSHQSSSASRVEQRQI